ncbi:RNA-binding protein [Candidatus Woesearchaeota archaeon]|nr:RNA-binding protein [Candidatus Woesearchaeota archaeon]
MSEKLEIQNKEIVVPGQVLAEGMGYVPGKGTYRDDKAVVAELMGIVTVDGKVIKIIPLRGKYMPKVRDRVIGRVIDVLMSGWRLDINCPYDAVLSMKDGSSEFIRRGADLTQYYALGEYVFCQVSNVTSQNLTDVTMRGQGLRKLEGGRIIEVNAQKIPRIIGKEGSMVMLIKKETNCQIYVGQNGRIWISGEPEKENIAVAAIRYIEENAHRKGVTDSVKALMEKLQ